MQYNLTQNVITWPAVNIIQVNPKCNNPIFISPNDHWRLISEDYRTSIEVLVSTSDRWGIITARFTEDHRGTAKFN